MNEDNTIYGVIGRFTNQNIPNNHVVIQSSHIVLATGGGIILSKNNRKLLIDNGYVIYLKSSCEDLVARMEGDKSRPLLQNGNLKESSKKRRIKSYES